MAHYLVTADVTGDLDELKKRLGEGDIRQYRPFGRALEYSLRNARRRADGTAVWEELDYCSPPLAQEREEVLDTYFRLRNIERVPEGEGWSRIEELPLLFRSIHD